MFSRIQSHVAKKQHECSLCGGVIEKGEQYIRTAVGGGSVDFCDDKYHAQCYELVERYCRNNLDHDDFFDMWAVIDDVRACVCDSCEYTKCKRNSTTIVNCDRVQKKYKEKRMEHYSEILQDLANDLRSKLFGSEYRLLCKIAEVLKEYEEKENKSKGE